MLLLIREHFLLENMENVTEIQENVVLITILKMVKHESGNK